MPRGSSDSADIELARELLEAAGLSVERVPERRTPTCDLRAEDDAEQYLFEVKAVGDDEAIYKVVSEGDVYESDQLTRHSETIRKRLDHSAKQLRQTAEGTPLGVVLLIVRSRLDSKLREDQVFGTLFGARTIIELKRDAPTRECLFFAQSAFFRHRATLDGAIVVGPRGAYFAANDYSARLPRLKASRLAMFFATNGAFIDRPLLEKLGYLVAHCDAPTETDALRFIAQKYGLTNPIECTAIAFRAFVEIPAPRRRRTKRK